MEDVNTVNVDKSISVNVDDVDVTNVDSASGSEGSHKTKRKKTYKTASVVWGHFTKIQKPGGGKPTKCKCNYCKKEFNCISTQGTSTLKRHSESCMYRPKTAGPKQQLLAFSSGHGENVICTWKFDQEACRRALTRMIIIDELPFRFIEREGFQEFLRVLQPLFKCISRTTLAKDCLTLYEDEKKKLKNIFSKGIQRVCLTTYMWTSNQNLGYMCLTAHYIDLEWKLNKRIINFCMVPSPHTGEVMAQTIELCLINWGIEKLCTITVDNATSNDLSTRLLRKKFTKKEGLVGDGEHFHVRCAAHVLNLIVKEGVDEIKDSISRIRKSVRYVKSSPSRQQQFKTCVEQEKIRSARFLTLDVVTRWNSTFTMLDSALIFQKAFERLEDHDSVFARDEPPTEEDWENAKVICKFLKTFYVATHQFSGTSYVTSSLYFHEVYTIEMSLIEMINSQDIRLRDMARKMKDKFDKYWGTIDKMNMFMIIAIILDPRYKLVYVQFCYSKIYPEEEVAGMTHKIMDTLESVFKMYQAQYLTHDAVDNDVQISESDSGHSSKVEFKKFLSVRGVTNIKSELHRYLEDEVEDDGPNFNILRWWHVCTKYRVLSYLARDILAIPVSTVASESAFSTGGRVLDQFRSSLTPKLVECLICAQDWLRASTNPLLVEENAAELIKNVEEGAPEASGSTNASVA